MALSAACGADRGGEPRPALVVVKTSPSQLPADDSPAPEPVTQPSDEASAPSEDTAVCKEPGTVTCGDTCCSPGQVCCAESAPHHCRWPRPGDAVPNQGWPLNDPAYLACHPRQGDIGRRYHLCDDSGDCPPGEICRVAWAMSTVVQTCVPPRAGLPEVCQSHEPCRTPDMVCVKQECRWKHLRIPCGADVCTATQGGCVIPSDPSLGSKPFCELAPGAPALHPVSGGAESGDASILGRADLVECTKPSDCPGRYCVGYIVGTACRDWNDATVVCERDEDCTAPATQPRPPGKCKPGRSVPNVKFCKYD